MTNTPTLKDRWLEALRSGEYEQGLDVLRDDHDRFCCLGVLADVIDPEAWGAGWRYTTPDGFDGNVDVDLPDFVLSEVFPELDGGECPVTGRRVQSALMWMNDSEASFVEIADAIEAGPERIVERGYVYGAP